MSFKGFRRSPFEIGGRGKRRGGLGDELLLMCDGRLQGRAACWSWRMEIKTREWMTPPKKENQILMQ